MISPDAAGALLLLALTDSLSFGTLLLPVWLLLSPGRLRPHKILGYLATVAAAYFLIGIALMAGGRYLVGNISGFLDSKLVLMLQLAVGIVLLAVSFALDTKAARGRASERSEASGRLRRWRERAMSDSNGSGALIALALTAVAVEVASMLPYVVATNIITTQAATWTMALLVLAGYCLVMVTPALVLTAGRVTARGLIEKPLRRLDGWLTRNARGMTLWIVGIAGFFLAASAIQALGWLS